MDSLKGDKVGEINVKFLTHIADLVGSREISVYWQEGDSVSILIERLVNKFSKKAIKLFYDQETGGLKECVLVINDDVVKMPDDLHKTVNQEDKVIVLPILVGG